MKDNIKAYVDRELGLLARSRVAGHLVNCPDCRLEMEKIVELTNDLRKARQFPAPDSLRSKVLSSIADIPAAPVKRRTYRPMAALAGAAVAVIIAAVVFPAFNRSNEAGRKASSVTNIPEQRTHALSQPLAKSPKPEVVARSPEHDQTENKWSGAAAPGAPSAAAVPEPVIKSVPAPATAKAKRAIVADNIAARQLIIIRTADLTLEVKRFQTAYDHTVAIVKSVGGYVSDSSAEAEETVPTSGMLTLRVPERNFDRTVEKLASLGVVKSRNINGQDVTGEVVDIQSRLRNKRAEETQFLAVMDKAKKVNDIVTVSNELYRVRGEIEQAEGRLKYLNASAAMSTITVTLKENEKSKPLPKSDAGRTLTRAIGSLIRTASGLASAAIWLGVYSPIWLPLLGIMLYFRRKQIQSAL